MKPNLFVIDKDKGKRERKKKKDTWSRNLEQTFIDMLLNVKTAGDGKRKRREGKNTTNCQV